MSTTSRRGPFGLSSRRLGSITVRTAIAAGVVWGGFAMLIDSWRMVEATVVTSGFRLAGEHAATRSGGEIVVDPVGGTMFLATIGPWCSSLSLVLCFAAVAAFVARGSPRRRMMAFGWAAGIVVVCNLIRIASTVFVGISRGAGEIESFHDGIGTAFAVAFVLVALAVFVRVLGSTPVVPARSPATRSRSSAQVLAKVADS